MTEKFTFVDKLPKIERGRNGMYEEFAAALRENSGKWALWPRTFKNKATANSTVGNIRRGNMVNLPPDQFEARTINGAVYVRHIGGVA
jgi:hypothetical protein